MHTLRLEHLLQVQKIIYSCTNLWSVVGNGLKKGANAYVPIIAT